MDISYSCTLLHNNSYKLFSYKEETTLVIIPAFKITELLPTPDVKLMVLVTLQKHINL